jgi:hypothetical protein
MSLPFPLLVFVFLAFIAALAIPAIVLVDPVKDPRYHGTYKLLLRKLYDYIWNFLMSGLGTAFVVLAVGLTSFWMLWGTWLVLAIFSLVLYIVWLIKEPRGGAYIRGRIHRQVHRPLQF